MLELMVHFRTTILNGTTSWTVDGCCFFLLIFDLGWKPIFVIYYGLLERSFTVEYLWKDSRICAMPNSTENFFRYIYCNLISATFFVDVHSPETRVLSQGTNVCKNSWRIVITVHIVLLLRIYKNSLNFSGTRMSLKIF